MGLGERGLHGTALEVHKTNELTNVLLMLIKPRTNDGLNSSASARRGKRCGYVAVVAACSVAEISATPIPSVAFSFTRKGNIDFNSKVCIKASRTACCCKRFRLLCGRVSRVLCCAHACILSSPFRHSRPHCGKAGDARWDRFIREHWDLYGYQENCCRPCRSQSG